ncbi:hypothetical protein CJ030_MR2G024431 [Morella rubra]|uniref:Uncharacterized protein n=1 Tax=Morella rubra TaxID=262757 RepID=A0A6A1WG07_9ROSI|nr:hypothetical protein CJ030_MR2G024462 [Morella rubra]KAB1224164.1 hypothetical protein CJ030_MR2G024431 [Morella rubra]
MAFVRSLSIEAKFLQFSASSSGIVTLSKQSRKSRVQFALADSVWFGWPTCLVNWWILRRRKRVGPGGSEIRQGSSFAQIVQAIAPEKKVAEAKESRGIQMGTGTKITQPTVGVPTLTHAAEGMRLTSSNCNHEVGGPAVMAGHEGLLWEHLLRIRGPTSPAKGENASAKPVVAGEALRVGGLLPALEKDASAKVVATTAAMCSSGLSLAMGAEAPSKAVVAVEALVTCGLPPPRVVSVGGICSGVSEVGQPGQCDGGGSVDVPLCSAVSLVEKEVVGLDARFEMGLSPSLGADCYAGGVPQGLFPQFCDLGGSSALGVVAGGELVSFDGRGAETSDEPLQIVYPNSTSEERAPLSFWVLEMLYFFRHLVAVSCDGHEEDLLTLFAALEKEKELGSRPLGRSGGKMIRELKYLECSVNYDGSASSSRRSRKVGRALVNYL